MPPGSSYELLRRLFLPSDMSRLTGDAVAFDAPSRVDRRHDLFGEVSRLDLANYTKNVLLRDTDAMSMAQSLEVRVPFLDHVLVEFVLGLPGETKTGPQKALLVDAVRDLLPREVLERPKHGFLLPIDVWMRTRLRTEVELALSTPPEPVRGVVDPAAAAAIWSGYMRGRRTWLQPWALYALCRWATSLDSVTAVPRDSMARVGETNGFRIGGGTSSGLAASSPPRPPRSR